MVDVDGAQLTLGRDRRGPILAGSTLGARPVLARRRRVAAPSRQPRPGQDAGPAGRHPRAIPPRDRRLHGADRRRPEKASRSPPASIQRSLLVVLAVIIVIGLTGRALRCVWPWSSKSLRETGQQLRMRAALTVCHCAKGAPIKNRRWRTGLIPPCPAAWRRPHAGLGAAYGRPGRRIPRCKARGP